MVTSLRGLVALVFISTSFSEPLLRSTTHRTTGCNEMGSSHGESFPTCNTTECYKAAANLMQSMDRSVDPCNNFFLYACGNWKYQHPLPDYSNANNWFLELNTKILSKARDHLEENITQNEPYPVTQAKILYKSCMNTAHLDWLGLEPMFEVLEEVGLPRYPQLPDYSIYSKPQENTFNWIPVIAKMKRVTGMDVLIGFSVNSFERGDKTFRLKITVPSLTSTLTWLKNGDKQFQIPDYLEYLYKSISMIYPRNNLEQFVDSMWETAKQVYALEVKLQKLVIDNTENDEALMPLQNLQSLTDVSTNGTFKVNWTEYFTTIFGDKIKILNLKEDDTIIVKDSKYLQLLVKLLSETPTHTVEMMLWWKVVKEIAPHTTSEMRNLKDKFLEGRLGTKSSQSRTMLCTETVKTMLPKALSYLTEEPVFRDTKRKIEQIFFDVRWAFSSLIQSAAWMDEPTKRAAMQKVSEVKRYIGFPSWASNKVMLENYYAGVNISSSKNVVQNLLSSVQNQINNMISLLGTKQIAGFDVSGDSLEVNAFYYRAGNSITIQGGILQFPFFQNGLEAMNYAGIGSTLGHELTHGFDNIGHLYDKFGNKRQWWSNSSEEEFDKRTKCFIDQYDAYELEGMKSHVNGFYTLSENIADNAGLRTSLMAYQRYLNRKGPEPRLPGLQEFSNEQLFFLSYANIWCENWSRDFLKTVGYNKHAPQYFRVLGSISNLEEFARIWNCPKGSKMNWNRQKCRIW